MKKVSWYAMDKSEELVDTLSKQFGIAKTSVGKWNYVTHSYDPYELPAGAVLLVDDLEQKVNCAGCGSEYIVGEMFTSQQIHQIPIGLGYSVCPTCHSQECETRSNYERADYEPKRH